MLASCVSAGLSSTSFPSSFMLMCLGKAAEGSSFLLMAWERRKMAQMFGPLHPHGKQGKSPFLLASEWLGPSTLHLVSSGSSCGRQFMSWLLHFPSSLGKQYRMAQSLGPQHPRGRHRSCSWLPASAQLSSVCCGHLGRKPSDGSPSLCPLLCKSDIPIKINLSKNCARGSENVFLSPNQLSK